ncbi:hypothetical protein M5K25_000517 [Dendrobium thyrsiflorum]|uniref:Uncharacterized protein n=1 Tax=Dendrobium thyrsiflorum TaxID=117978 RepID=A0ABD0VVM9_DENTH
MQIMLKLQEKNDEAINKEHVEDDGEDVDVGGEFKSVKVLEDGVSTNLKGELKKEASHFLKSLVADNDVFFIGFLETMLDSMDAKEVKRIIGLDRDFFHVNANGTSVGILALWKINCSSFSFLNSCNQCIVGSLKARNGLIWMVTIMYGNKNLHERRSLWKMIEDYTS